VGHQVVHQQRHQQHCLALLLSHYTCTPPHLRPGGASHVTTGEVPGAAFRAHCTPQPVPPGPPPPPPPPTPTLPPTPPTCVGDPHVPHHQVGQGIGVIKAAVAAGRDDVIQLLGGEAEVGDGFIAAVGVLDVDPVVLHELVVQRRVWREGGWRGEQGDGCGGRGQGGGEGQGRAIRGVNQLVVKRGVWRVKGLRGDSRVKTGWRRAVVSIPANTGCDVTARRLDQHRGRTCSHMEHTCA
jgi:hypothetical protein